MEENTSFTDLQPFFNSVDENSCFICAEKFTRSSNTRSFTQNSWNKVKHDAEEWKDINIPEDHKYFSFTLVFDKIKEHSSHVGKVHGSCRTAFQTKSSNFKAKYGTVDQEESNASRTQQQENMGADATIHSSCRRSS